MQARAVDGHEADLFRVGGIGEVVDRHARRPIFRRVLFLGVMVDGTLVIVLLIGEFGLCEHVLVVDDEQLVLGGLQMQRPGVVRRGDMFDRFGIRRVSDVDDREALGEDVADVGVAFVHHDLHAIAAPALVAVADEAHV